MHRFLFKNGWISFCLEAWNDESLVTTIGPGHTVTPYQIDEWKVFRSYPFTWEGHPYEILCARDPSVLSAQQTALLTNESGVIARMAFGRPYKKTLLWCDHVIPIVDIPRYKIFVAGCTISLDDRKIARFDCPEKILQKTLVCTSAETSFDFPLQAFVATCYFLYRN